MEINELSQKKQLKMKHQKNHILTTRQHVT